jgi:WD40-like Beta Propeller Repeat
MGLCTPGAAADGSIYYDAVVFDAGPGSVDQQVLRVFPLGIGKERNIILPVPVHILAIGPDGSTLYARASPGIDVLQPPKRGLLRIDLTPVQMSLIPGSSAFAATISLAVWPSQDKILVSGPYVAGPKAVCGVYEFALADGKIRKVVDAASCDVREAWTHLSLSQDGLHAIAIHRNHLELIDLASGVAKSVGDGFEMAAWSPDGKWIAAREHDRDGRTALIDANTFVRTRTLESTAILWSPDGNYLLRWSWAMPCGSEMYSLEKVNIATGKTSIIESSRCKASGGAGGWVSSGTAGNP